MIDKTKTKDQKMREEIGIILEEHGLQWKYDFTGALVDSLFEEISKAEKEMIKVLKRIKLELDVCVCECGEKWSETDLADLVNEYLDNYLIK